MLVLGTFMILATQIFGAEEEKPRNLYFLLIMQGEGSSLPVEDKELLMKNFTAGVNGSMAEFVPGKSSSTHKFFRFGPYNKEDTYYIEYKDEKTGKQYTYDFHLTPAALKQIDAKVGGRGFPWYTIVRTGEEQDCSDGPCIVVTFIIATNPPMLKIEKPLNSAVK